MSKARSGNSYFHSILYSGLIKFGQLGEPFGYFFSNKALEIKNGKCFELIDCISSGNGWDELFEATAVNVSGQIVGTGKYNGQRHAFLLTPINQTVE
jgi:probable HAF family extracellular repeat protein